MVLPFLATATLDMQAKTVYAATLSAINTLAIMVFYLQFPLSGRIKHLAPFANINWSLLQHKKLGQWLGLIFLLHPILILAPRFMMSFSDGLSSLLTVITAPQMLTGIIAWIGLIIWVLMAIFKDRLKMSYETWRATHVLGFVTIAVLATFHITSVGSHGQFLGEFNWIWWSLCGGSVAVVLYNYLVKPIGIKAQPFELMEVKPASTTDWLLTLKIPEASNFDFEPGQFVWFNTQRSGGVKDHPFSIASAKSSLPEISFLIRNLGDYTGNLQSLTVGQEVFVDGPYGSISMDNARHTKAIVLIAGGAGIGPNLSLLRGFAERNEQRPVRLIYGNQRADQMVLQDEIHELENQMRDFKQQLVCAEPDQENHTYQGVIDQTILCEVMADHAIRDWTVYLCGPEPMIKAVTKHLKKLGAPGNNLHFEQMTF